MVLPPIFSQVPRATYCHSAGSLSFLAWPAQAWVPVAQSLAPALTTPKQCSSGPWAGTSPAKAVEKLRIEAAQLLVQDGRHPIEVVARQTGFGESERMRRAFQRAFGKPPQAMRRDHRGEAARQECEADLLAG